MKKKDKIGFWKKKMKKQNEEEEKEGRNIQQKKM